MLLVSYTETVKFHFLSFGIMNIRIRNKSDKCNNNRAVKAKAAMPIAGILAAAALMAELLSPIGIERAIAQENMTATDAITTAGGATNATMAGAANATNATMAGAANATNATMAGAANATEGAAGGAANATGGNEGLGGLLEGIFGGGG
jgi:hypothetical protein